MHVQRPSIADPETAVDPENGHPSGSAGLDETQRAGERHFGFSGHVFGSGVLRGGRIRNDTRNRPRSREPRSARGGRFRKAVRGVSWRGPRINFERLARLRSARPGDGTGAGYEPVR